MLVNIMFINYIILNFYGQLELYGNCFFDNKMKGSPVLSHTLNDDNISVMADNNGQAVSSLTMKLFCEFIAEFIFYPSQDIFNFTCFDFDNISCNKNNIFPTPSSNNGMDEINPSPTHKSKQSKVLSYWPAKLLLLLLVYFILYMSYSLFIKGSSS